MKIQELYGWFSRRPSWVREAITQAIFCLVCGGAVLWLLAALTYGRYYAASFAAALAMSLGVASFFFAKGRSIRHQVVALLWIYIALILLYGAFHYSLFLVRPEMYAFSESIEEGKVLEEFAEDYRDAMDRSKALYVLARAHMMIDKTLLARQRKVNVINYDKGQTESEDGFVSLDPPSRIRLRQLQVYMSRGVVNVYMVDVRFDSFSFSMGGDVLDNLVSPSSQAVYDMHVADSREQFRSALERLIEGVHNEREDLLVRIRGQIGGRSDWNMLDFVYFSAVTLTTLGYGDILPNSTLARFIVLLNSVSGVFFAAFALTVLWSNGGTPMPSDRSPDLGN